MSTYPRRFLSTAMVYLLGGALFGALMAADPERSVQYRFIHIHLLFLGFMVFLGAGLAYEAMPRLLGAPLKWPRMVPAHYHLANVGLVGKCVTYLLQPQLGPLPFAFFASVTVLSLILFTIQVSWTLRPVVAAARPADTRERLKKAA